MTLLRSELTHPELLAILATCGHGDSIAVVDSNYPAHAHRLKSTPFMSLNITQGVIATPLTISLIAASVPIEKCTLPVPRGEESRDPERLVHTAIRAAVLGSNPGAEFFQVTPEEFYVLTSAASLAVMVGTGERSHYGSAILTVGYLPELETSRP